MQEVCQMDNNNPAPQLTGTTTAPNMNPPQPQQPVSGEPPKSSRKMILILVTGFLVAIVLIGGVYFYVSSKKVQPSQIQTPPQTQDVLERELESVNVEDLETEFATVEADLQNL